MKKASLIVLILLWCAGSPGGYAQVKVPAVKTLVEVYYFHPSERCPIDQSIEQNLLRLMQNSFAKEVKDGTIKFQVVNTDDKSQAKTVARFDINSQALYVVKLRNGKETKNDLTHFAFDYGQSNPERFRSGLKVEIEKALQ
ncbi:MAG: nitrophenyl compound nitroreductase subunit ArsF family protein [Bacteroidetes bacterium]|nr:nitrophenyl compound nitroreductase subunit ArsF family protein [Bacteroidota bacterium]